MDTRAARPSCVAVGCTSAGNTAVPDPGDLRGDVGGLGPAGPCGRGSLDMPRRSPIRAGSSLPRLNLLLISAGASGTDTD